MKNWSQIKTISLTIILFLSLYRPTWADSNICVPSQFGTIKEAFECSSNFPTKTVIYIQDAHCNYEAQKNMTEILEYLIKEHGLKLIMVEGGSGNVDLSFTRSYMDKEERERLADDYLRTGKISGEEYLNIVTDYNFELYGIEDEALYDAHLVAFEKVDAVRDKGLRYLESLSSIVNNLKSLMYSKELIQLESKNSDYENKTISLVEYCHYLKETAHKKGLSLNGYPHLSAFSQTTQLEKEIDFEQAESERNAFIKDLAELFDEGKVKALINRSKEFKSGNVTHQQYYSFLKTEAEAQGLNLEHSYPQLNSYIRYITVSNKIDTRDLLKEVDLIEERIKQSCLISAEQRRLNEISESLQILIGLLNLELTPKEYEYFQAHWPKFLTVAWIDFLSKNCNRYNAPMSLVNSNIIDDNLKQLEDFYKLGVAREEAFIKNIVNKMDQTNQKLAVLIAGGFHTPGVTRMLKDKSCSYVVITPVITKRIDSSAYFSVLRGEK